MHITVTEKCFEHSLADRFGAETSVNAGDRTSGSTCGEKATEGVRVHTKLLIWGASGHALVVVDIARLLGKFEVVGHIDNVNPARAGEPFSGTTVLGGIDALA